MSNAALMKLDTLMDQQRLSALRDLMILDTDVDPKFNILVDTAANAFNTPISAVTLIDAERQWFKASVGLSIGETPRNVAFCDHAIREEGVFVVEDAINHQDFSSNPLVLGAPFIRSYAGAPIILPSGTRIGAVCVIDQKARSFSESERRLLEGFAKIATHLLFAHRTALKLQEALMLANRANEAKSAFLAMINHEFRTPLNAIVGFSELMKNNTYGSLGDARNQEKIDIIHDAGLEITDLVNDLVNAADFNYNSAELTRIDLIQKIADVIRFFEFRFSAKNHVFNIFTDDFVINNGYITGDRGYLRIALSHIIKNAALYSPPGSTINVRLSKDQNDNSITLSIEDNGPGISDDQMSSIGEPLNRGNHLDLAHKGSGLGLGLFMTKRLFSAMNASMTIHSILGVGTIITIKMQSG